MLILIVEDSPLVSNHISRILKEKYEIAIADNGKKAIDLIEKGNYKLILLDWELPDINGNEILKIIRKNYNSLELPVIMISGKTDTQLIQEVLNHGANDFITKPFDNVILSLKVRNLLQLQQTANKLKKEISAKENSRKQLHELINKAPIAMLLVNEYGLVKSINQAGVEMLGTSTNTQLSELPGKIFNCVHDINQLDGCGNQQKCDFCTIRNAINETLETRKNIYKREGTIISNVDNGHESNSILVSTTLLEENNNVHVLLSIDNITEQKKAEKKIKLQNLDLKEANDQLYAQAEELMQISQLQQETNEKLTASEEHYRSLLEKVSDKTKQIES